jgi:hypothetical protein
MLQERHFLSHLQHPQFPNSSLPRIFFELKHQQFKVLMELLISSNRNPLAG